MASNIGHQFIVGSVSFQTRTDTFINIQKKRENVSFKSSSHIDNVNLAYIQSLDINSDKNLSIVDKSYALQENRFVAQNSDQIFKNTIGFTSDTDLFLLTDVFTPESGTTPKVPLFFRHKCSAILNSGDAYFDIKVLDDNFNKINSSEIIIDLSTGSVFSNLENKFNIETGLYSLYFIDYSVRNNTGVIAKYIEILDNKPIYHLATIDDIDPDTGWFYANSKAYLIEDSVSNTYSVVTSEIKDYGVRKNSNTRVQLIKPSTTGSDNPWFVKVKNGKFISSTTNGIYKYYLPEFGVQDFQPYPPYKYIEDDCYFVTKRICKTNKENISISIEDNLYLDLFVYSSTGDIRFALTSDETKVNTLSNRGINFSKAKLGNSKISGIGINDTNFPITGSSIDTVNGFIVLPSGYELSESDTIVAEYYYTELEYEVTSFDFNPLNSQDLLNKRIVFLLRPQPLFETINQSLYWLVVNEDGLVIDSNIDFELAGFPGDFDNQIEASGVWYNINPSGINWAPSGALDFINQSTVQGSVNLDDLLILGDVYTRNTITPNRLVINDVRIRGGGLIDPTDVGQNLYWDINIWDGISYPGAASILVDVPLNLLEIADGQFSPNNLREVIKTHISHGIYPVVHSYNEYTVTVTGINYLPSGVIQIQWAPGPDDTIYNIYSSSIENGDFELIESGITDNEYLTQANVNMYFAVLGYPASSNYAYIDGPIDQIQKIEV